jgi:dynein heavy chain
MVGNMTQDYHNETKRRIYVTPRSFLDLLHLYRYLLKRETADLQDRHHKFSIGLKKMGEITVVIKQSKRELDLLRPVLEEKAAKTEELLKQVTRDTKMATEAKNQVALETEEVEHQADTVRMIQVLAYVPQTRMRACVHNICVCANSRYSRIAGSADATVET